MHRLTALLLLCLLLTLPLTAQEDDPGTLNNIIETTTEEPTETPSTPNPADDTPPAPSDADEIETPDNGALMVEITAADGLPLVGEFFPAHGGDGRAVLLLHQLYTTRASWYPQIEPLRAAGFHVLAVDLRGYGATGGALNWTRAQADTLAWLTWLTEQDGIRADGLVTMGTSMGANLALNGCTAFAGCAGAVAISPGRNYFGVRTDEALMAGTPNLIIYADRDQYPRRDVPHMQALEGFNGEVWAYPGRAHGIDLFPAEETLLADLIGWMQARL